MAEYHWQQALESAIRRNRRDAHHRYFQLATIGEQGRPRNRSLVFRGFAPQGPGLLAVTDRRSDKFEEIRAGAGTEICWYFTRTREQFRIAADAAVHHADSDEPPLRETVWASLSAAAREQFFMPAPGRPLGGEHLPASPGAPATFCVLLLAPLRVDHLSLSRPRQRRWVSRPVGEVWESLEVNP